MHITQNNVVAVLGDVHGRSDVLIDAVKKASEYTDTLIQIGDLWCYSNKQRQRMDHCLLRCNMQMVFIPGNHEDWDYLDKISTTEITPISQRVMYAPIGSTARIADKNVLFAGGAMSIDKNMRTPHVDWFPQETISTGQLYTMINSAHIHTTDVMFTHDCPADVDMPDECFGADGLPVQIEQEADNHRKTLQSIVDVAQPALLMHGHYHHYYQSTLRKSNYSTHVVGLNRENLLGALTVVDLSTNDVTVL